LSRDIRKVRAFEEREITTRFRPETRGKSTGLVRVCDGCERLKGGEGGEEGVSKVKSKTGGGWGVGGGELWLLSFIGG